MPSLYQHHMCQAMLRYLKFLCIRQYLKLIVVALFIFMDLVFGGCKYTLIHKFQFHKGRRTSQRRTLPRRAKRAVEVVAVEAAAAAAAEAAPK